MSSIISFLCFLIFLFSSIHVLQLHISAQAAQTCESTNSIVLSTHVEAAAENVPGLFLASIRIGTPPQETLLIVDTGSTMPWTKCNYSCPACLRRPATVASADLPVFDPNRSSSFKPIPCLPEYHCENQCNTPNAPCVGQVRYQDGSNARGLIANETLTVDLVNGEEAKLKDVTILCSWSSTDFDVADGVMGLDPTSPFLVKAFEKTENKFSYCWLDIMNPTKSDNSYLIFGNINSSTAPPPASSMLMQYTELDTSDGYAATPVGISLDGVMLNIPPDAWRSTSGSEAGLIFDSGTTMTILTTPAYDVVMSALEASLVMFEKVDDQSKEFEYCFNDTGFDESTSTLPKLAFHFKDGAKFAPPAKNYIVEVGGGVRCLAVASTRLGMNIIGNIMQQGHHWEYNLASLKLGFAPSNCTLL